MMTLFPVQNTKRWLLSCLLIITGVLWVLSSSACSLVSCSDDPACLRVLFIGNSYTYVNDLPNTLVKLAQSGGNRLETGMAAQGGWTLSDHLKSAETIKQIQTTKWNFVVLQEQSMIPANDTARNTQMYPVARKLVTKIKDAGAQPLLFVTWAHRAGWPQVGLSTYENMQLSVNYGYLTLGQQLHIPLAPVGYAWLALWRLSPPLNLWQEDGSHPNELGTYLAACVFYAAIFQKSPEGLTFLGGLSTENAHLLQSIAAKTVLSDAKKWNLP